MYCRVVRNLVIAGLMSLSLVILSCAPAPAATPAPVATTPAAGTVNPTQADWDNTVAAARALGAELFGPGGHGS